MLPNSHPPTPKKKKKNTFKVAIIHRNMQKKVGKFSQIYLVVKKALPRVLSCGNFFAT
jgi:hypothetical protein